MKDVLKEFGWVDWVFLVGALVFVSLYVVCAVHIIVVERPQYKLECQQSGNITSDACLNYMRSLN